MQVRTATENRAVRRATRKLCAGPNSQLRGPEVGFGEVWNILGSVVIGSRRLRQASGCRSFFFSPSILGNDNVLYHSLFCRASPERIEMQSNSTISAMPLDKQPK